jgi:FkbM family methyltransferase
MDIGANIGYFSAALARAVGKTGRVWSFEPVPPTYRQLCIGRGTNGLAQMITFPIALGNTTGEITIRFRKDMMGSASAHLYRDDPECESATVALKRLDDLWAAGEVGLPKLIKIDVEGHERDVIAGALKLITAAKPVVVFEYNAAGSAAAGWTLQDLAALFQSCGHYRFFRIHADRLEKVDPATLDLAKSGYADFIASTTDLTGSSSAE